MVFASHPLIWHELESVESTQDVAAELVRTGGAGDIVLAHHQTSGRGRLGRTWHADPGDSLAMSLIFREEVPYEKPYLLGMALAIAAAGIAHAQLRWPNDIVIGERKVGGVLTEMVRNSEGVSVPVVGIGLNLNQATFPPQIDLIATSLHLAHGGQYSAREVAEQILTRMSSLPEPKSWADLAPIWGLFDRTRGKNYRLASGEEAVGLGIGSDGQLLCAVNGESRAILAAEAIFGS